MATSERRSLPLAVRRLDPGFIPAEMVSARSVLVAFGFECNFACRFCMVEDALGARRGLSLEALRAFVADGQTMRGVERIVLSGGEVTLDDALLDYVAAARRAPGVRHVRLQTNGTRLASPRFVDALVAAGVDEFFVSLHGATAATCDDLTRVKGSFRAIRRGLEVVAARPVRLLINTCIVEPNHRELPALVDLVAPLRPAGLDFWNLWPRLDPHDERRLQARVGDVRPHLIAALDAADRLGVRSVVKWFPRCLLDHHAAKQDNHQPTVLIHEAYWEDAPDFSCLYGSVCVHGQDRPCAGLSHAYVRRFGWEESTLRPERQVAPAARRDGATAAGAAPALAVSPASPASDASATPASDASATPASDSPATPAAAPLTPEVARWLTALGLRPGDLLGEGQIVGAFASGGALGLRLRGPAGEFELRVAPRSPSRPVFLQTARFGVSYACDAGLEAHAVAAARALAGRLRLVEARPRRS